MRLALQMYDLPEVRWATDALGAALGQALRRAGFDAPEGLDRALDYKTQWTQPDLLLAQACGYPLVTLLAGQVRYVATPCYDAPGCEGPRYCSFLVVRRDDPAKVLGELRGRRAAFNRDYSQSGYNALRHAVAPLARGGRFFGRTLETGGHLGSLEAVAVGGADVAAVDCVTHALARRHRPAVLEGLRVLARTAAAPGLPLITRAAASDEEVERLRQALREVFAAPELAEARAALLLAGLEELPANAYASLTRMQQQATALGYPTLS